MKLTTYQKIAAEMREAADPASSSSPPASAESSQLAHPALRAGLSAVMNTLPSRDRDGPKVESAVVDSIQKATDALDKADRAWFPLSRGDGTMRWGWRRPEHRDQRPVEWINSGRYDGEIQEVELKRASAKAPAVKVLHAVALRYVGAKLDELSALETEADALRSLAMNRWVFGTDDPIGTLVRPMLESWRSLPLEGLTAAISAQREKVRVHKDTRFGDLWTMVPRDPGDDEKARNLTEAIRSATAKALEVEQQRAPGAAGDRDVATARAKACREILGLFEGQNGGYCWELLMNNGVLVGSDVMTCGFKEIDAKLATNSARQQKLSGELVKLGFNNPDNAQEVLRRERRIEL